MSEVLVEDKDTNEELSWHLKGNWGPIKEEITSSDLKVVGEIPSELKGTYIRNGFNQDLVQVITGSSVTACFIA